MPGKILIAEPLATNRILLKVKLAAGHFEVIQASDAAETLRAIRLEAPDLVLLNSGLAGNNLATLIDAIRALPGQADLPIAALITEHLPEAARRDLAGRVDALLVRPTTDTLLLARLRGLLVQRNTLRDLRLQSGGGAPGFAEP
ncbi:MAG: diguanylate cyclase response regulator, partial [Roseovarius sp.]|nr:diguanylate cyclase response regulator [Roseovarius sp.]